VGSFTPCGGDLVGTWTTTDACMTLPTGAQGADPYAVCTAKPKYELELEVRGTITFRADGTFQSAQTITASSETVLSNDCISKIGNGQLTCDLLDGKTDGSSCVIEQGPNTETGETEGTFRMQGSQLTLLTADAADGEDVTEYCVRGNVVTLQTKTQNGAVLRYAARRK